MSQLTLPGMPARPELPKRRVAWRDAVARLAEYVDARIAREHALVLDDIAADTFRHDRWVERINEQFDDLRSRVREIERHTNADIAVAPRTAARLRAFAGNGT